MRPALPALALALGAALLAACGLQVQSADLFVVTRSGEGTRQTLLVNDAGSVSCDGGKPRPLSDPLLLQARDLATALDADAKRGLRLPAGPDSVYRYTIRLQDGTISFPDTAAAGHHELSQAELFALQATQASCG